MMNEIKVAVATKALGVLESELQTVMKRTPTLTRDNLLRELIDERAQYHSYIEALTQPRWSWHNTWERIRLTLGV